MNPSPKFRCLSSADADSGWLTLQPGDNVLVTDNGTFVHLGHDGTLSATFAQILSVNLAADASVASHTVVNSGTTEAHDVQFAGGGAAHWVLSHEGKVLEFRGRHVRTTTSFEGHVFVTGQAPGSSGP